jgi:cytochrome c biogenesis protein
MAEAKTGRSDSTQPNTVFADIKSFFTSVRTTITLLFLLAATSIIGTVIPQGAPEQFSPAGPSFYYRLALILDLHNVYRSWWFILLLVLLSLNLLGCLLRRLSAIPSEWKGTSRKTAFSFTVSDSRSPENLKGILISGMKGILGAPTVGANERTSLNLEWRKHRIYLLGFPFIHLAIIVILLGGLIGLFYGVKGHILIKEGEIGSQFTVTPSGAKRALPFQIAVDSFTMTRYPTGEPKEFRSDVRLLEDGRDVVKDSIRVNHPLTFRGISLYQSDYRALGVKEVKLRVVDPSGRTDDVLIRPHSKIQIPGSNYQIQLLTLDPGATKEGPWVEISAESPGTEAQKMKLLRNSKGPVKLGEVEIGFLDYVPLYATGLQIGYDPGSTVVWVGCIMLITGFFLTLFTNQRGLMIQMKRIKDGTEVKVSGSSRRLRREFREAVEKRIRDGLETSTS